MTVDDVLKMIDVMYKDRSKRSSKHKNCSECCCCSTSDLLTLKSEITKIHLRDKEKLKKKRKFFKEYPDLKEEYMG